MKNVRLLTEDEIRENGGGREGTLRSNYASVRKAVENLPGFDKGFFINPRSGGEDADFPDDEDKVDVTFGLLDMETGAVAIFWNYKNGPVYNKSEGLTLEDINEFSVGFPKDATLGSELLARFQAACSA